MFEKPKISTTKSPCQGNDFSRSFQLGTGFLVLGGERAAYGG